MRSHRRVLSAALALIAAISTMAVPTGHGRAKAVDGLQCRSTVPVFTATSDGSLWQYSHDEPETGQPAWSNVRHIGNNWTSRTFGGTDGHVFSITDAGELRRFRWLGDTWENGGAWKSLGTNWGLYSSPEYQKRLTVDSLGDFYTVDSAGDLVLRRYIESSDQWASVVLDNGWNQYDQIVAAGQGVLYARKPNGDLRRFRYHAASQRWLTRDVAVGQGWQMFKRVFSPGADLLYAIRDNGDMLWYRYIESTGEWILDPSTGLGRKIGSGGWAQDRTQATSTDGCSLTNEPNPDHPVVTVNRSARAALAKTGNGHLQYSYVNGEGRLVHAEVNDVYNVNPNGFATIPGYSDFTGTPSIGENQNGLLRIYAQGTDSNALGVVQTALGGSWSGINQFAGRMLSAPQLVRTGDGLLTFVAMDKNGEVWFRPQKVVNGPVHPWRKVPFSSTTTIDQLNPHLTALSSNANTIQLYALAADGDYRSATVSNGVVTSQWSTLQFTGGSGALAVVGRPDGPSQLFARRVGGLIHQRSAASGAAWTPLLGELVPGVTAAGGPSALMAPDGRIQVAVRGTDGYVYRTGQTNPGSTSWLPWSEITQYAERSAVDPTLSLAADTWVVAFRTPDGNPRLRRYQPTTTTTVNRTATEQFVDVPMTTPTN